MCFWVLWRHFGHFRQHLSMAFGVSPYHLVHAAEQDDELDEEEDAAADARHLEVHAREGGRQQERQHDARAPEGELHPPRAAVHDAVPEPAP
jgi:hypothetical protein